MNSRISLHTEHGALYGELSLRDKARGLVMLAHAGTDPESRQPPDGEAFAALLRRTGLATLTIDLLTHQEDRFPDVHNNVPLLAKRLLDCLSFVKRQVQNEGMTALPIGLCGTGHTSPAVLRVAALRDQDISAVVCRGGLIDLAGVLYLRSLQAPILVLVGADEGHFVASSRRALQEVSCRQELKLIAANGDPASPTAFDLAAREAAQWFVKAFPAAEAERADRVSGG